MAFLNVKNIHKIFDKKVILQDLSFQLEQHKTLAILGKSGCGKTTLLKIIAGIIACENGNIYLDNQCIDNLSPQLRSAIYLYQEPLLFPHLNVFENIAFGLKIRNLPQKIILEEVENMLTGLGLYGLEKRSPNELSGGQKQRVAFGRALIIKPKLLLLDEPFGALDNETRVLMQTFFKKMASEYKITTIFVTHDLKEALLIGDVFALMEHNQLHLYSDKTSFIDDEKTGIKREIEFWKNAYGDTKF